MSEMERNEKRGLVFKKYSREAPCIHFAIFACLVGGGRLPDRIHQPGNDADVTRRKVYFFLSLQAAAWLESSQSGFSPLRQ